MTTIDKLNNLFKYPLFGKDSSPEYTAPRLSIIVTILFWLLFLLFGLFIHPNKKPKFETVQIVLESTPIEKTEKKEVLEKTKTEIAKTINDPEPVKQQEQKNVETPKPVEKSKVKETPAPVAQQKKTEAPKQPIQKKTETPKSENYTKAPEYKIKKSNEELMEEQAATRQSNAKSFDWSQFDDEPVETTTTTKQVQKRIDNSAALSGSAGSAASSKTSSSTTTSTNSPAPSEPSSASSNTTASLGKIAATTPLEYSSKSFDGTSESVALVKSAKTTAGKVTVAMDDGSNRALIYPSKPVINISDENAKLINSTKTVTISFRVLTSGNVPRSAISISPSNILPNAIQNEILDQLSSWLFESSDSSSVAMFEFTILIK